MPAAQGSLQQYPNARRMNGIKKPDYPGWAIRFMVSFLITQVVFNTDSDLAYKALRSARQDSRTALGSAW